MALLGWWVPDGLPSGGFILRGLWRALLNPPAELSSCQTGTWKLCEKGRNAGIPLKNSSLLSPRLDRGISVGWDGLEKPTLATENWFMVVTGGKMRS